MFYVEILVKLVVTVILLMIYVKISGKSQLAPMSAFDQIGNMVVGAIGGTTLLNPDISVLNTTAFMAIWIAILLLIRYLRSSSLKIKTMIDGKRLPLMLDGAMISENFKKANISVADVETLLHSDDIEGLYEVDNIWFETNGQLTFDKKGDNKMSTLIIEEGIVNDDNLEHIEKDGDWLKEELKKHDVDDPKKVFFAEWIKEDLWVYPYSESKSDETEKTKKSKKKTAS